MITIKKAEKDEDFQRISTLAHIIWHEHFTPIIGERQVTYMLDKFQSYEAIRKSIRDDGYLYYMALDDGALCAYIGVHPEPNDRRLFISKVYVEKTHRGKKISKALLAHVTAAFPELKTQWLTVNKHNADTIAAYQKMGFSAVRTQCTDIGGGFVMDDYVMERRQNAQ